MAVTETVAAHAGRDPDAARARRDAWPYAAYWLYLLPGAVLFLAGHRRAAGRERLPVADQVVRRRRPAVGRPGQLHAAAARRACSGRRSATPSAMIVAMVVVPTLLGLLLAAVLFDYIGQRFSSRVRPSLLRAAFYLPQVLPVVVAGIVWGWILRPRRRAQRAPRRGRARRAAPRTGWATRTPRCSASWRVMIWVQIGYPVVIFMAALQRVDPELYEAAELDGAGWWRRFRRDHRAADPAGDLRRRPDLHDRRAEGVRPDVRADPGRPGQRHRTCRRTSPTARSSRRRRSATAPRSPPC